MISLIIPMYNNAHTIARTLEHVIKQTKSFDEVIIVDNGSTDKSAEIVREQIKAHASMKYIYCSQKGASAARNKGLEVAKSPYVAFLDADDLLKQNYVETLTDFISDHADADMYHFNFYQQFKNGIIKTNPYFLNDTMHYDGQTFIKQSLTRFSFEAKHMVWTFVFKKAFLDQNNLRFNTDVQIFEDVLFLQGAFRLNPSIFIVAQELITYQYNDASLTQALKVDAILKSAEHFVHDENIQNSEVAFRYFDRLLSRVLEKKRYVDFWLQQSQMPKRSIKKRYSVHKIHYFLFRIFRKLKL